jgi:glycosyltransferase involved in cell wall biosynthesis
MKQYDVKTQTFPHRQEGSAMRTASAGRIVMLVQNSFPDDTRVKNEATTLRQAGYHVAVICLRERDQQAHETINGVDVYRFRKVLGSIKPFKGSSSLTRLLNRLLAIGGYCFEYFYFIAGCFLGSAYIALRQGFDILHVHTPPDTLFLIGAFYRLCGKKFVFDHHDLSPELYLSRFRADADLVYRVLLLAEKLALRMAHVVLATNESYKRIEINRAGIQADKVFVVRNGPDLNKIKPVAPDKRLTNMHKTIVGYVGEINPQDGLDYLLRSLWHVVNTLGRTDVYCVIIGDGDALDDLKALAHELDIEDYLWFTGYIFDKDVLLRYLSAADICVSPDPSSPFNDVSTSVKIMEYMALHKPIVSFGLAETRYSAQGAAVYVPPNDEKKFAEAIVYLMDNPAERARMGALGYQRVADTLAWQHVSKNLECAYRTLFPGKRSQEHTPGQQQPEPHAVLRKSTP